MDDDGLVYGERASADRASAAAHERGATGLVERYSSLIERTPRIEVVPADRRVIDRSVRLRADFSLRSMDALHVGTALVHRCDTFVTNDKRLHRIDRPRMLDLDDVALA